MRKKWNVMFVPNSPERKVHSFNLSSRMVWATAAAVVAMLLLTLSALLYAVHEWQNERLAQISHLESELEARDVELEQLNREFSVLKELEAKLRTIAGLKPRERAKSDATGGKGGPGEDVAEASNSSHLSFHDNNVDVGKGRPSVQELLDGSLALKDSFSEVRDVLERERARLSSIPSINPVVHQDAWISSGFGYREDPLSGKRRFHEGCDIVAPRGTSVIAPADGIVTYAGWRHGMGRMLEIEHGYGYTTAYGHNDKLFVRKGDLVKRGDLIAHVGSSGRSTGPHLHYEVRLDGRLVNPYKYVIE